MPRKNVLPSHCNQFFFRLIKWGYLLASPILTFAFVARYLNFSAITLSIDHLPPPLIRRAIPIASLADGIQTPRPPVCLYSSLRRTSSEEPVMPTHHVHGDDHVDCDSEGRHPRQKSRYETHPTDTFRHDSQEGKERGYMKTAGKPAHSARQPIPPKHGSQLLHAMRKEHYPEYDPEDHARGIVLRLIRRGRVQEGV